MKHLHKSFQAHVGQRGAHFYSDDECQFLTWKEVFTFLEKTAETLEKEDHVTFTEKLSETLANYDPDLEFLAVKQTGSTVTVELYSSPAKVTERY
jgi:hypothetical protein